MQRRSRQRPGLLAGRLGVADGDYLIQVGGYNCGPSPVSADNGQFVPGVEFAAGIDATATA